MIEERVKKLNAILSKNKEFTQEKACSELGLTKGQLKAVRRKYMFDVEQRQFILKEDSTSEEEIKKLDIEYITLKKINEKLEEIERFIIEQEEFNKSISNKDEKGLDEKGLAYAIADSTNKLKGKTTARQMTLYSDVNNEWKKFNKTKGKLFKATDLLSLALMEFMEKYKDK